MDFIYVFGIFVIISYLIQVFFSIKQTKHFNENYCEMRRRGKVLIGKKKGYLVAGTIIILQVNQSDIIESARILQGITVFTKFKSLESVRGLSVLDLDHITKYDLNENRLTIKALKNAKGNYIEYQQNSLTTV
jgi:DNA-binding transcriptional regulator of glucitol operon